MFSKKMDSAGYTSGTNIFTLCCGFPVGKRNGRKNSDELGSPKDFTDVNGENGDEDEKDGKNVGGGDDDGGGGGGCGGGGGGVKCGDENYELTYDEISDNNEKSKIENVKPSNGSCVDDVLSKNGNDEKPECERLECAETESVKAESVKAESIKSESMKSESVKSESVKAESVKAESVKAESVKSEIINDGNSDKGSLSSKSKSVEKENGCVGTMSDNGSTKSKSKKERKHKNGAAYQYEDESSSDSDDEVMKHYKENLVRSASMRSAKSAKTGHSKRPEQNDIKSSKGSLNRLVDPAAAAELGEVTSRTSYNAESDEERHRSPQSPHHTTTATPTSDSPSRGNGQTFENRAFQGDGQPSMSESDLAQSTEQLNSDEHLFDVSDLQNEPPLISKCGSLEVSFRYDNPHSRMVVVIHGARDIPSKERGGASSTQVRVMLLPGKKQRHKSKIKMGDNPTFGEKIYFNKMLPDEVPNMGLRFRLYGLERMRRERMIGESIVGFASLNLDQEQSHWVVLEPRSNLTGDSGFDVSSLSRSDSASSTQSLQHGGMPELLLGLSYNGTTGRLSVEAIKGSNFRNMAMNRPPDTYVKLSLMNSVGQEVQHCKTSVRRGQPNPLFKETFMLQVALFQLPEVTLMVSVYNKKSMKKKEMIGWFSLGMNSSGEEEASHWLDMRESKGEQVCRWHVLLES